MKPVILDAGPLVAWLCPRDQYHEWSLQAFSEIRVSGVICEAVLTEVCHLASKEGIACAKVVDFVIEGGFRVETLNDEFHSLRTLVKRYADVPMDFADACVTRLAEIYDGSSVCTTDSDFLIYRKNRTVPIPLLAPFNA